MMFDQNMLIKLLKIPNIKIIKTELTYEDKILIHVETDYETIHCRKCGKETEKYHGLAREIQLRHFPILDHPVFIIIKPKRGKCSHCDGNPTTNQKLDWYDYKQRHTKAYENYILRCLINSTVIDVSLKEQIGYDEVNGILTRNVETKVDWKGVTKIGALGIDEIAIKKGYKDYFTIITSHTEKQNSILKVLPGKEKVTVKAFFNTIPRRLRKTIIAVCSDLYEGYINAAKEVFKKTIPIVADRFHVANKYRECLIKLRISELKRLKVKLPENQYKTLKESISILKRNNECMSDQDLKKLDPLFKLSPDLKRAFKLCRKLTSVFNSKVPKRSASKKINTWISDVKTSGLKCFDKFLNTINEHKNEILNYFKARQNSGFVEGLNNKIKVIKRRCYGIFETDTLFQRLFLDLSGYRFLLHQC